MSTRAKLRPAVAAGVLLAMLASAYQLAPRPANQMAIPPAARAVVATELLPDSVATAAPLPDSAAVVAPNYDVPTDETSDSCWTGPLRYGRGSPAARRPRLVRHYVGTVGGQPASALLHWQNPDSVAGTGYLHQRGPVFALEGARHRRGPLVLGTFQENPVEGSTGDWHLTRPPGGNLVGTWRGRPGGRPQALVLRESYAGAVRLAIETTYLRGGWAIPGYVHCINMPTVGCEFLCAVAPDTVPLALRAFLAPTPAARHRATRVLREGDAQVKASVTVRLNDWNLLSYQKLTATSPYAGRTLYTCKGSPLLDLAGGQAWSLVRLLRPNFGAVLGRLAARHLLHDAKYRNCTWTWAERPLSPLANDTSITSVLWLRRELVPRPEAYVFTSQGLELLYWPQNLGENPDSKWLTTVLLPYRELRPLVRPGTPLARMLRARGLW